MANRNRARTRAIKVHMFKTGMPYSEAARIVEEHDPQMGLDEGGPRCWPIGSCESREQVTGHDSDSASMICHHCDNYVCVVCGHNPVLIFGGICNGPCGEAVAADAEDWRWLDEADEETQRAWREESHRTWLKLRARYAATGRRPGDPPPRPQLSPGVPF